MTVKTALKAARVAVISDKAAADLAPAPAFTFKGRNAMVRGVALGGVSICAFAEGKSRADVIAQLRIVLGKAPTPAELAAAKAEYVAGRVAQKLGNGSTSIADQLATARRWVLQYAAPVKDGVKAKSLRKGQLGRRTPEQHKAIRAAEETFYLLNAELGFGKAQTMAEKNKRQAAAPGSTARGKKAAPAPSIGELVKGTGVPAANASEACSMVFTLTASLLAYCNKNAAHLPTDYGLSVKRFHGAIAQLEKARIAAEGTEA